MQPGNTHYGFRLSANSLGKVTVGGLSSAGIAPDIERKLNHYEKAESAPNYTVKKKIYMKIPVHF